VKRSRLMNVQSLVEELLTSPAGVSISGGEPLDQWEGLVSLCEGLRSSPDWGARSIILYTGYTVTQLRAWSRLEKLRDIVDVLIAGPYDSTDTESNGMFGSSNQEVLLFSDVIPADALRRQVEVDIDDVGNLVITGFPSTDLIRSLKGP
jgi:organic radical activating enzyme